MAIIKWQGGVEAVAQIDNGSIDSYDAASTYTVTIGDYSVSVVGNTDVATTAGNLVTALLASTHPFFAAITWSGTGTITATADVAGAPFLAVLSVAGGTGTITDFAAGTACTGPHHTDAVDNWAGGALPTGSDDVVIDAGPSILYGLTAISATALGRATVKQSYTGLIGLEPSAFATSLDGATTDADAPEYRATYLELTADEIVIGAHNGPGSPSGSARVCIEQKKAGASVLDVQNTASTAINSRPAVRYLAAHASADIIITAAPAGVGVAVEAAETATVGDVTVSDDSTGSAVYIGAGTTLTNYLQHGGLNVLAAAATVTAVIVRGGELRIVGYDYLITTMTIYGGEIDDNHVNTAAAEWVTINAYGGTLKLPNNSARAYTTLNLYGGRIEGDWSVLTGTEIVPDQVGTASRRAIEITDL
tara:strand:- start:954 stop:2216 length:1263 start_codon:yes stop_codon:yes gene_type:complete